MPPNIGRLVLLTVICFSTITVKAQYGDDYQYTLNFELDSKTGTYRPAYTYKAAKGNSTIWLDGANKTTKTADKKDDEKLLIAFKWPQGWKVDKNAGRAQAVHPDSSSFTIYASRSFPGTATRQDIVEEWNKRKLAKYGPMAEKDVFSSSFKNGGTYYMYVKAGEAGGAALAIIYSASRAIPVLLEFPSQQLFQKHRSELKDFLESIAVKKGKIK